MPGRSWSGKVVKIGVLPDAQSFWTNPDLKVYNTEVHIDGDASDLRPGMSCRAEVFVDRYEDAVQVPVQCVVRLAGEPTVYVVAAKGAEAAPRTVKVGLDNGQKIRIVEGLSEGEKVLLNPPLVAGGAEAPPVETPEIPKPAEGRATEPEKKEGGAGAVDWGSLSREERRKRFEQLPPEEQQKMREQFRRQRGEPAPGSGD
jgi:HlyD family secretion protein